MKKRYLFVLAVLPLSTGCVAGQNIYNYLTPDSSDYRLSNDVTKIELDDINLRVEILDKDTIRFETKYTDPVRNASYYTDRNTFLIPARDTYHGIGDDYKVDEDGNRCVITFNGNKDQIIINKTRFKNYSNITIRRNGKEVYNSGDGLSTKDINNGDLPVPGKDEASAYRLIDYPRILIPNGGYNPVSKYEVPQFYDTNGYEIQDTKDLYVMLYDNDAIKLRRLYNKLAGPAEMVRLATLGAWDSRYYPYNEHTVQLEVDNYHKYGLPLDNFVIDTDWRFAVSGTGYNVNTDLFPDMPRTLASLHAQNLEVAFNDHPEPVRSGANVLEVDEVENRYKNLRKILDMGLDTWWYDRNWSTSLVSPVRDAEGNDLIRHETWGDYLFNDITRQYYRDKARGNPNYRRPTTMTNLVDVANGTWNGTKDTASHRYSFQWTGDTVPDELPTEINNVVKAGNNGVAYMSSDLAAHTGDVASNYYYSRWIQYGALSPIFRIHCTRDLPIHCQPWYRLEDNDAWEGDPEAVTRFKKYVDMRYRLIPLFYQLANENYETGLPLARALAFKYPNDKNVAGMEDEWMLGNNILFAPLSEHENQSAIVTGGEWTVKYHNLQKDDTGHYPLNTEGDDWTNPTTHEDKDFEYSKTIATGTPLTFNDMTIDLPEGVQKMGHVAKFTGSFTPTADFEGLHLTGSVDDGIYVIIEDQNGGTFTSEWKDGSERKFNTGITLEKGKTYKATIYYYQNTGGGVMKLFEEGKQLEHTVEATEIKSVYLPKGDWYDPFHDVYYHSEGQWTEELASKDNRTYSVDQNAIFIRLGGMIPLVENAPTTKDINWKKVYYDVYPSTDATIADSSYLYEDDHDSVAYQNGEYRKSQYDYHLTEDDNYRYVNINLGGADGYYGDDYKVTDREYILRVHSLEDFKNANIESIMVDGEAKKGVLVTCENGKMPFGINFKANENDEITEISVPKSSVRKAHQIVIKYKKGGSR